MLRSLVFFITLSIACSKGHPAPTAPAGKAADCSLMDIMNNVPGCGQYKAQDGASDNVAPSDTDTTSTTNEEEVVVVDSTAIERFNIELLFAEDVSPADKWIFRQAAKKWEDIILQGLPDVRLDVSIRDGYRVVYNGTEIDDVLILVQSEPEDPNQIRWWGATGYAEVFYTRPGGLPAVGQVTYGENSRELLRENYKNSAYNNRVNGYPYTESTTQFIRNEMMNMACHEIGHVLGIGTIDQWRSLVVDTSHWSKPEDHYIRFNRGTDHEYVFEITHFFTGPNTFSGFERIRDALKRDAERKWSDPNGSGYYGSLYYGVSVPLDEDQHHWHPQLREGIMDIMTPILVGGETSSKHLTHITRAALVDLGYDVDMSVEVRLSNFGNSFEVIEEAAAAKRSVTHPTFICTIGDH